MDGHENGVGGGGSHGHKRARVDVSEHDEHDDDDQHHHSQTSKNGVVEHPPPPKDRRFKLSRACDRCRRRRIKCDEGHPCQSCINANSSCTFEEQSKRTSGTGGLSKSKSRPLTNTSLEDRMQHLESLIQSMPNNIFQPGAGALSTPAFASGGVPPPSIAHFGGLANPASHFASLQHQHHTPVADTADVDDDLAEATSRLSLTHSYLYLDDQGSTRWQGESSGLPLLDVLLEEDRAFRQHISHGGDEDRGDEGGDVDGDGGWRMANRTERGPRRDELNPGAVWRAVTAVVPPDLMDSLVQVYLSTSHYLYPFLHVPTFLADYASPPKWGEPGFASFILAICALASRHTDDPRVRQDPADPLSAGTHFLELFHRLRSSSGVPGIDRPSLYSIQAALTAAVYCIGLGRLSRGAALLSEAITLSVDIGLHRSTDAYDSAWFAPGEEEARSRTFWAVYCWDKQFGAAFGRPVSLRLRDCDVRAPRADEEFAGQPSGSGGDDAPGASPAEAFLSATRIYVVLEGVLSSVAPLAGHADPFLHRAAGVLVGESGGAEPRGRRGGTRTPEFDLDSGRGRSPDHPNILPQLQRHLSPSRANGSATPTSSGPNPSATHLLYAEERLLDGILASIPGHWAPSAETLGSSDVLRVTQATRVLCMERFVRMLIHRHRLGVCVAKRAADAMERERNPPTTPSAGAHTPSSNPFGIANPYNPAANVAAFGQSASLTRSVAQSAPTPGHGGPGAHANGHGHGGALADVEREAIRGCHAAAVGLVAAHLSVASKGLMTYYGVHVIHQLTQAGRSLLAVLLECQHFINELAHAHASDSPDHHPQPPSLANQSTEALYRSLVPSSIDALRSCLGLLRRFSGRYVCGLRSADLIEECCRRTRIPLDVSAAGAAAGSGRENELSRSRRPWLRPVKRKSATLSKSAVGAVLGEDAAMAGSSSPESGSVGTPPTGGGYAFGLGGSLQPQQHHLVPQNMFGTPLVPQLQPAPTPPFLGAPMPGGMDVLEYGMLDGGMGLDMGQLDLLAMLDSFSAGQGQQQQQSPVSATVPGAGFGGFGSGMGGDSLGF